MSVETGGTMHVGLKEGDEVGTCLRDDKVVYVEELGDAGEGRVTIGIRGVGPWAKSSVCSSGPGDYYAG